MFVWMGKHRTTNKTLSCGLDICALHCVSGGCGLSPEREERNPAHHCVHCIADILGEVTEPRVVSGSMSGLQSPPRH